MSERPLLRAGRCTVCCRYSAFVMRTTAAVPLRRGLRCVRCGSRCRNRHVALIATQMLELESFGEIRERTDLRVLNTSSNSAIANQLGGLGHVENTSFWDDIEPGEVRDGVRCEDLTCLTYPKTTFDLVITEDVLEHIPESTTAFEEIHRVLKHGGFHVFSVPLVLHRPTEQQYDLVNGSPQLREPITFHADPIRGKIPVFYEYGYTLFETLAEIGFRTRLIQSRYRDQRDHVIIDCMTLISRRA